MNTLTGGEPRRLNYSPKRRYARALMYFFIAVAGVVGVKFPSGVVSEAGSSLVVFFWAVAMAFSAAVCFGGSLFDRWLGEYAGLPLLIAVLALYGVSTLQLAGADHPARYAYGFLIISYAFGLFARWRDVNQLRLANLEGIRNEQREG